MLVNKGYHCLIWMLTPYQDDRQECIVLEDLFYKQLRHHGRSMVECAFGMLKMNWQKMLVKFDMRVTIVLDIFTCYILHNLKVSKDSDVDIKELIQHMEIDI